MSENLEIHVLDHFRRIALREVRIPLHHLQRLVSKHLSDLEQRHAVHGQIARTAMTKIVKSEVADLRFGERLVPVEGKLKWSAGPMRCVAGEDEIGINSAYLVVLFQKRECEAAHGNLRRSPFFVSRE